jgi:hypothetical protein
MGWGSVMGHWALSSVLNTLKIINSSASSLVLHFGMLTIETFAKNCKMFSGSSVVLNFSRLTIEINTKNRQLL